MPLLQTPRRLSLTATLVMVASLLSCGREITGPEGRGGRTASVAFAPHFPARAAHSVAVNGTDANSFSDLVPFNRVRVTLRRGDEIVVERVVPFGSATDSVALGVTVTLSPLAGSEGETFSATLEYLNASDAVVFIGGPINVLVRLGNAGTANPVEIALEHVGPGSGGEFLNLNPSSITGVMGDTVEFTAVVSDNNESTIANAVVLFVSRDTAIAKIVTPGAGRVRLVGARGATWIIAELFRGDMDSSIVVINPTPTTLSIISGNAQQTVQNTLVANPLRVQVRAADNLGVAGWPVTFAVTSGQGSLDSTVVLTDANGFAQTHWTAGDSVGVATVTASISGPTLSAVFTGTQLASGPTTTTFETQPVNITAGSDLPNIQVAVRNGAAQIITAYSGPVTLSLTGGTAGAVLLGGTTVNAVAGIATFSERTVDLAGTNYRLVANVTGTPQTQSNTFNVAAAPPALLALVDGGGQSAPASTTLVDSMIFRVTDAFGHPVAGVTVTIAGILGGGSVSPVNGPTSATGHFATAWTLGESGPQQITASVLGIPTANASATVVGGGGPSVLFAGYDYTYIPAGQSRSIPVFLSAPSGSPTTVHLSVTDSSIAWQSDSVQIPAGITSIGIPLNGLVPGEGWAILTSALGTDSVFVLVDSASLSFPEFNQYDFTIGDTLRTMVLLSDPAPAGGVVITVRSSIPEYVLVAPGTGLGTPLPACLGGYYCYGGDLNLRAAGSDPLLLTPPADTALLFVPEGQLGAQLVMIPVGYGIEVPNTIISAEAAGYGRAEKQVYVAYPYVQIYGADGNWLYDPVGLGQRVEAYAYRSTSSSVREVQISLVSRDTLVFTVDASVTLPVNDNSSGRFHIRTVAPGANWLVVSEPASEPDSVLITVTAPALRSEYLSLPSMGVHATRNLGFFTTGAAGYTPLRRMTSLPITWTVTNPAAMSVDAPTGVIAAGTSGTSVTVRMIAAGDGYLVATAPEHAPDSVFISVSPSEPIGVYTGERSTGEGQYAFLDIGVSFEVRETTAHTVTVTSLNPGIARALTPQVELTRDRHNAQIQIVGVSQGVATIQLSAPGFTTTTFTFTVSAPKLMLVNLNGAQVVADTVVRTALGFTGISGSNARPPMDTVVATLRSSNPAVIEVTDSVIVFAPGTGFASGGGWRPLMPGSAILTLHAPGYIDSDNAVVTVKPFRLFASFPFTSAGVGLEGELAIFRDSPISSTLPITITQLGPGVLSFAPGSDSVFAGTPYRTLRPVGVTPGVDTIIVSSPGFISDTVVITVSPSKLLPQIGYSNHVVGQVDPSVSAALTHSGHYYAFAAGAETQLVLRSRDTTRARVVQDTIKFAAGDPYPFQMAAVKYEGLGWVTLVIEDPDGIFAADSLEVYVQPRTLFADNYFDGGPIALGMSQRTDPYELYVSREYESPDPLVVYLTSSDTTVVTVPDSVLIESGYSYGYFGIAAGDTVGSARITASSPGWNEAEWHVVVTRGKIESYTSSPDVGGVAWTELYLVDAITQSARETTIPVPMQLVSDQPAIADAAGFTFEYPANQGYHIVSGVLGVSPGRAFIRALDTRVGDFQQMVAGASETEVYPSSVYLLDERVSIGLGLQSSSYRTRVVASPIRDSVWVHLSSVGGKFALPADSVLLSNDNSHYLDLDLAGITLGVDTLLMSADGLGSDTAVIVIEQGILHLLPGTAPTIVVGDSTLVTLELRDASGVSATASTTLTINFSIDTTFAVTDGTSTIGLLQIDPGSSLVSFWVRAEQFGTSELLITSPNFRTFRYVFTTREIPGL